VCDQLCNKILRAEFKRDKYSEDKLIKSTIQNLKEKKYSGAAKLRKSTIQKTKLASYKVVILT
jgi:hypothetical protein